ncbi:MAG: hypothetical protein PHV62_03205 [Sulfuricurvum sp.]|nr:hypothetical protein [Sulfuricurvum sp.]
MPIQFPDFQRISYDEANPLFKGIQQGMSIGQSAAMFPQDLQAKMLANQIAQVQAKYAEPMAAQGLTKAMQENQWNPKIWQSEIGLRGAEAGKLGKETQWYDKEAAARIGLQQAQTAGQSAEAQMNQMKLRYLQTMMQGQQALGGGQGQGGGGNPMQGGGGSSAMGGGMPQGAPQQGGMPQQGSAPMQGGATPMPAQNTVYGVGTPSLTPNDIANKMLLGIDTFTPRMENAKAQQQDQYKQYQSALADTIQQANSAQKAKQVLAMFNNAMDNSSYKGPRLGNTPSSGWTTAFVPGNLSNEQIADNAVSNLLPGAITELREAMKSGQFSVADLNAASRMKVSRTMTDEARQAQSAWLNGVYDRFDEKSKFYSTLGNPTSGAQKVNADMLWEQYQRDFPLISEDGKTYQGSNLGNWPLYTTPKAIASVQTTGTYSPSAREKNTFMMQVPDGKGGYVIAPIKKGKVESAFRKGAKPL